MSELDQLDAVFFQQTLQGTGGLHQTGIALAEDKADVRDSLRKSGLRVVERLQKVGILGPATLAAHCVHVDRIETEILLDSGTMVVHNPRSNMNNAVGVAPVEEMLRGEIAVGLGNDGFSNNMWAEWKAAYFMHKQVHRDPRRADLHRRHRADRLSLRRRCRQSLLLGVCLPPLGQQLEPRGQADRRRRHGP